MWQMPTTYIGKAFLENLNHRYRLFWVIAKIPTYKKYRDRQVHFTLEGLRAQRKYHRWKVYMDSYMTHFKMLFIICWDLRHAHLQEVSHANDIYNLRMKIKGPHNYAVTASVYVWQISFVKHLQIQSVMWHFQNKNGCQLTSTFCV